MITFLLFILIFYKELFYIKTIFSILEKEREGSWLLQSHCYLNRDLSHSFSSSSRAFPASRNTTVRSTSRFHHNNINNLLFHLPTTLRTLLFPVFRLFLYFRELRFLRTLRADGNKTTSLHSFFNFIPP